ncbi:Monothiol glutaredoxin [Arachis hypogaea]|nr:Monothiol glutaredoxin [Arachis hypogaea]
MDHIKKEQEKDPELLLYDLSVIAFCIDNFLDKNKLGEGGFGSVFKHCWKFPCLCNWKRTKLLWHESMSMNLNGTEVLGFGLVLWWKYKHNQQAFFDVKGVCYLSTDFPHAHFLRVEVEEQPEISEAYSVSAVPFFVFFKVRFDLTRLVLIPSMIMFLLS